MFDTQVIHWGISQYFPPYFNGPWTMPLAKEDMVTWGSGSDLSKILYKPH